MAWRRELLLAGLCFTTTFAGSSVASRPVRSLPQCSGVSLSASYLAVATPGQTAGFRFTLSNRTGRTIRLVQPVPSSTDWYARSHGRWEWRSSNGAGGSLLNAGNQRGRVVVYPPSDGLQNANGEAKTLTLLPHQSAQWIDTQQENPVLEYKPGCKKCSYPGEREYRVVFAYAYAGVAGQPAGLLSCGLRSAPVPMPPKN